MTDIEIGMNVIAKIYLHIVGNDLPTPFEAHRIKALEDSDFGTIIHYIEHNGAQPVLVAVVEDKGDINAALKDAEKYRDAGLNAIQSMLE